MTLNCSSVERLWPTVCNRCIHIIIIIFFVFILFLSENIADVNGGKKVVQGENANRVARWSAGWRREIEIYTTNVNDKGIQFHRELL